MPAVHGWPPGGCLTASPAGGFDIDAEVTGVSFGEIVRRMNDEVHENVESIGRGLEVLKATQVVQRAFTGGFRRGGDHEHEHG